MSSFPWTLPRTTSKPSGNKYYCPLSHCKVASPHNLLGNSSSLPFAKDTTTTQHYYETCEIHTHTHESVESMDSSKVLAVHGKSLQPIKIPKGFEIEQASSHNLSIYRMLLRRFLRSYVISTTIPYILENKSRRIT